MVALAFIAGILVSLYYAKKEKIKSEIILDLAIYVIVASIIGARSFYVIGQWDLYKTNLLEVFMVQRGGLVVLGGVLFSIVTIFLFAKKKKISFLKLLDSISPGTALGLAIGRVGCFLNGCCFGLPARLPWAIKFPPGSLAHSYFPGEYIHPTQIYSVLGMLTVFGVVTSIYRKKRFNGQIFFAWVIGYSIYRFIVEFFRYSPIHWLGLTPSQWIVAIGVVVAVAYLFKKR